MKHFKFGTAAVLVSIFASSVPTFAQTIPNPRVSTAPRVMTGEGAMLSIFKVASLASLKENSLVPLSALLLHPPLPSPKARVIGEVVEPGNVADSNSVDVPRPMWGWPYYFLHDVQPDGSYASTSPIGVDYGVGPGTLTLSVSKGVSATYSDNAGVNASIISAGVGYDVTGSYTLTSAYSVQVPSGQEYELEAFPLFDQTSYQVWYNPVLGSAYQVGTGTAAKPTSLVFVWFAI